MYKVSVTEKEAREIGEGRWVKQNRKRYMWLILGLFVGGGFLAFLLGPALLDLSDWASTPLVLTPFGLSIFFVFRASSLSIKAGKEFIKSLGKEV